MRDVTKQIFLNASVCLSLGWLQRSEEISKTPTIGEKFIMEQGIDIHRRARDLYPKGILVDDPDKASASKKTRALMDDPSIPIILEGTFCIDGFVAKADILKRKDDAWHMIEVKSSVNDKAEFIDDMAYTAMVIERAGYRISQISLLLVSKDFRLGMRNENLFVEIVHTKDVRERIEAFQPLWEPIEKITKMPVKPQPKLRFECRKCEIFRECLGKDVKNHIFDIPRLSQTKFERLMELGVVCIENIPNGFSLTTNQKRVCDCVHSKKPFVGNSLRSELENISWPAFFLDFETVSTAIPLYPDVAPYTQIPTLYSAQKCSGPGNISEHLQYLADPSKDSRRELAKQLINDLGGEGSIIVYSNFEKRIINDLSGVCPDLSKELGLLISRLVDLNAIIRRNFYHPDFHGTTSIKTVLLALALDISYDDLKITDGLSAMATSAYLARGKYDDTEAESARRDLLEYCKRDTLAEVKLHQKLVEEYV